MPINLKGAQAAVERLLLVDHCQIITGDVRTGDGSRDLTTGVWTPAVPVVLYDGFCYVGANNQSIATTYVSGGVISEERKYDISLPRDEDIDIWVNDIVVIDTIHADGDQELVNRRFLVEHVNAGTYTVLRKLQTRLFQEVPHDDGD